EKEFVERAVNGGEFAQLGVADEIDAVEGRVQGLQTAHVAVIAQEVAQKTPGNLGSIGTPATGHAADGSGEIVGGKSAPFLNQALDAVTFGPIDQRILQLLRIDARRVFREQWHDFVRRDDVFHHGLVFEKTYPAREARFLRTAFGRGFVRSATTYQSLRVFGRVEPGIQFVVIVRDIDLERAEKFAEDLAHAREAVGIAVPVAQHDVLL